MSLSVDDLVSSLNSSHIGQEAIDLAALHAQLAQTLFASSTNACSIPHRNTHTCNTPITRTPSASISFSHMPARPTDDMSIDEDERMVEELLMPSSPVSAPQPFSSGAHYASGSSQQPTSPNQSHLASYFPVASEPSPSSVFASTDPFYLAAMQQQQQQQQQQQSAATSFFAQNARLGQNSPFFVRPTATQHQHQHSLTIDTSHSIFASTAY